MASSHQVKAEIGVVRTAAMNPLDENPRKLMSLKLHLDEQKISIEKSLSLCRRFHGMLKAFYNY